MFSLRILFNALLIGSILFFGSFDFDEPIKTTKKNLLKTVCLDAGHGGKDPGCHGPKGNQEGKVTLKIILEVGKLLKATYPDLKVVYTRDTDTFIELNERANIANRNKADLFITVALHWTLNRSV